MTADPGRKAVFLSHTSFTSPFRVGSHQLAHALSKCGWEVLHIATPITPLHLSLSFWNPDYRRRAAAWWQGARQISPCIREYIPFTWIPWQVARSFGEQAPDFYSRGVPGLQEFLRRTGFSSPGLLLLDEPRMTGMLRWFTPNHSVYRATDLYSEMLGDETVLRAERRAILETDGFVATSQPVYQHLKSLTRDGIGILVENGVDIDHFLSPQPMPEEYRGLRGAKAIYVGALDDRFDPTAVNVLARARRELTIFLVGPANKSMRLTEPNIRLLGPRPYEQIPAYLQHAEVGLLPLSNHSANRGRSPMKIYEYGAAGLPVIASRTAELERRGLPFVFLYEDPANLPVLADNIISDRKALSRRAVDVAMSMSWDSQLERLLSFTKALLPGGSLHSK